MIEQENALHKKITDELQRQKTLALQVKDKLETDAIVNRRERKTGFDFLIKI